MTAELAGGPTALLKRVLRLMCRLILRSPVFFQAAHRDHLRLFSLNGRAEDALSSGAARRGLFCATAAAISQGLRTPTIDLVRHHRP